MEDEQIICERSKLVSGYVVRTRDSERSFYTPI